MKRTDLFWSSGGALAIVLLALWVYYPILFPPAGEALYPWGSDTLGHVFRAEYMRQQMAEGSLFPELFPGWYMGIQLLRYYPPLPYYLMIGLGVVVGNLVTASNWVLALCAIAGGLTWLLYHRWIGWLPAIIGGLLFVFLPDNLRVAFAEGNIPRSLATALLPLAFYYVLRVMDKDSSPAYSLGVVLGFAAVVLCHAMMAAIYAACVMLFIVIAGLAQASTLKRLAVAGISVVMGVLLSGWWLLPHLTGGITELNTANMTEALAVFPLQNYLSPSLRTGNPEAIYIGAVLLIAAAIAIWTRPGRSGYSVALILTGLFGVLITTNGFNGFFNALPFHNLLWPLRFLGIASFLLLLALMWHLKAWVKKSPLLVIVVVGLLVIDNAGSLFLIRLRLLQPDTLPISQEISRSPGWREATLDLSLLGSEPSYFYASLAGREQLYGWAYQGARTARRVAALNEALQSGFIPYIVDRLALYGADDVVLLKGLAHAPAVASGLEETGFRLAYQGNMTDLFHRDNGPRAYVANWPALGIGRGAQNLAYLFPQIILGTSLNVDDYSFDELTRYKTLFLSGFTWKHQRTAEEIIKRVADAGVNVVVDLTGIPEDPLARIPRFLDVWGERLILAPEKVRVQGAEVSYNLLPFGKKDNLWYTHTPQGLQHETLTFDYLGETAAVLGYNTYGAGRVWFIGINLPYHTVVTNDAAAIQLVASLLQLPPGVPSQYTSIPLANYQADQQGYQFSYTLQQAAILLVPVAYHEGMNIQVDGALVPLHSYENLLAFEAPSGKHKVVVRIHLTRIYQLGWIVSGLGLAGIMSLLVLERRLLK